MLLDRATIRVISLGNIGYETVTGGGAGVRGTKGMKIQYPMPKMLYRANATAASKVFLFNV